MVYRIVDKNKTIGGNISSIISKQRSRFVKLYHIYNLGNNIENDLLRMIAFINLINSLWWILS